MMLAFYFWTAALLCGLAMSDSNLKNPFGPLTLNKRGYQQYAMNLAEGKKTGQSSTGWNGVSGRAVDGIWLPHWSKGTCTHTLKNYRPYWWVDLGRQYQIFGLALQNRGDCCAERLSHIKVWVGNSLAQMTTLCATHSAAAGLGEVLEIHCRRKTKGRYVKIELMKTDYLTLCEVAVFGR